MTATQANPASPPAPGPSQSGVRPLSSFLVLAAFLLVYSVVQWRAAHSRSATYDEALHLTAGYAALTAGDHRFDPTHPPLMRLWAALPLLGAANGPLELSGVNRPDYDAWAESSYAVANDFVFGVPGGPERLASARLMNAVWGAALGVLLFLWARELLGFVAASLALLLYSIEPNLAGHAGLVTTDAGVTCLMVGALYVWWRLQARWTYPRLAVLAACFALALTAKFSGVVLVPILGALAVLALLRGRITGRRAVIAGATLAIAGWVAVWAVYGFQHTGAGDVPAYRFQDHPIVKERVPLIAAVAGWADDVRLLPSPFAQGFIWSQASARALGGYLFGEINPEGWLWYFPVAFLVKTPVVLLGLLALGLCCLARRRAIIDPDTRACILVPPAVFLGLAVASHVNLGIRHLLPVYPFVVMVAAVALRHFWIYRPPLGRALAAVVTLAAVGMHARTQVRGISFFNAAVGGAQNGSQYLSSSNLDWGQHLVRLREWMAANGVERINLAYFGAVDPDAYGIVGTLLPGSPVFLNPARPELPGYVAISDTVRVSRLQPLYAGFEEMTPVAVIGGTMRVYWAERWPDPPADIEETTGRASFLEIADYLHYTLQWHRRAVVHYRRHLEIEPGDVRARNSCALALIAMGQVEEGVSEFEKAAGDSNEPGPLCIEIAVALVDHDLVKEAEPFALRAVMALPSDSLPNELLGVILAMQGRLAEAETRLLHAVELDPLSESAAQALQAVRAAIENPGAP